MNKLTKKVLDYHYDKLDDLKEKRSYLTEELDIIQSEIERESAIISRIKIHGVEVH